MPGPVPKRPELRQRRNRTSTAALLPSEAESKNSAIPPLPELGRWHPMVVSWWEAVWTSPMASEYLEADKHRLYRLAVLHHDFWRTKDGKERMALAAEIAREETPMGLTPVDRRRLQWEIEKGEQADDRLQSRRKARRLKEVSKKDPRDVLKVV